MATIEKTVEELGKLSVLELVELRKALEEAWDVTAAAPVAIAAAPAAGGQESVAACTGSEPAVPSITASSLG